MGLRDMLATLLQKDDVAVQVTVTDAGPVDPDPVEPATTEVVRDSGTYQSQRAHSHQSASFTAEAWSTTVEFVTKNEDERLVTGVVYEPGVVDAQGHWATAETVQKMAHGFAMNYALQKGELGTEHTADAARRDMVVVESYIAPVDIALGEQIIRKGSWVMTAFVQSDDLWSGIKKGEFTGWSLEGRAALRPAPLM